MEFYGRTNFPQTQPCCGEGRVKVEPALTCFVRYQVWVGSKLMLRSSSGRVVWVGRWAWYCCNRLTAASLRLERNVIELEVTSVKYQRNTVDQISEIQLTKSEKYSRPNRRYYRLTASLGHLVKKQRSLQWFDWLGSNPDNIDLLKKRVQLSKCGCCCCCAHQVLKTDLSRESHCKSQPFLLVNQSWVCN